jgi:hypothetical protein
MRKSTKKASGEKVKGSVIKAFIAWDCNPPVKFPTGRSVMSLAVNGTKVTNITYKANEETNKKKSKPINIAPLLKPGDNTLKIRFKEVYKRIIGDFYFQSVCGLYVIDPDSPNPNKPNYIISVSIYGNSNETDSRSYSLPYEK